MKHLYNHGTFNAVFALLFFLLFISSAYHDAASQSVDSLPPVLAHQPVLMGNRGAPLNIIAHVADESGIKSVAISINYDEKSITGIIPERTEYTHVPVVVEALQDLEVYSGPGHQYSVKAQVIQGEKVQVTHVKGDYYRIKSELDVSGYVKIENVNVVTTGKMYGVAIPPSITSLPEISYQIIATDLAGNVSTTDMTKVVLLTEQEIAEMRKKPSGPAEMHKEKTGTSFFARPWFWATTAIVGGGTYYFLTQQKDEAKPPEKAVVDVSVEW